MLPNGIELEEEHNKQGLTLTEKIKKELEGKYRTSGEMQRIARELNVSSKYAGERKVFLSSKTFLHKSRKVG
ncbi:hypothetical protein AB9M92_20135 [Peribacillus frigoritolerans]|uniref:hypothetical protein n=1 Tax=Peribacillus frigoritolerans TaxID=450367 RepID=UPI0035112C7D